MRLSDAAVEADYPPEGTFLDMDGWRIHHLTEGQGRDVLLLHGAGGSTRDVSFRLMPALRKAGGFRVTALDRPGHGWTSSETEDLAVSPLEQASLIWRACDALGLQRPLILGQSYGGAVALAMGLLRPEAAAGLCLVSAACSTALPWGSQGMERLLSLDAIRGTALSTFATDRYIEMALARLFSPEPVPVGYVAHFGPRMSVRDRCVRHLSMQIAALGPTLQRMGPLYGTFRMPVTILHGTQDEILDHGRHGAWLAQRVPGARFVSLPEAGHMAHQTRTLQVVSALAGMEI